MEFSAVLMVVIILKKLKPDILHVFRLIFQVTIHFTLNLVKSA
jgi:hypothetical protein